MDFITETGGSESLYIIQANLSVRGHAVAYVVGALRFKPEGRGSDSRWGHWGRTMALASIQSLTETSTRNISWGVKAAGA